MPDTLGVFVFGFTVQEMVFSASAKGLEQGGRVGGGDQFLCKELYLHHKKLDTLWSQ